MKGNSYYPHITLSFFCLLAIISVINSQKTNQCGRTVMDKVIGGKQVARGTYPWMVGIVKATDLTYVTCGAALITRRYVLTAKSCIKGSLEDFKLLMGTVDLKLNDSSVQLHSIEQFIGHEGNHDIGLIKTDRPVKLDSDVQPICLPPGDRDYSYVQAVLSGWGETNAGYDETGISKYSNILMDAVVNTTNTENCNKVMARHNSPISDDILCAGSYGGQPDHCYGDTGGPLMYYDQDSSIWQLIGVITAGYFCGVPDDYNYYANVTFYRDWIISNSDYEN